MHEAKWSRAKVDADTRRTGGSTFRAAISSARNERTSRLWARATLFEHAAAPGQARAAPVEYSAPPGRLERHPSSILRFGADSSGIRRAFCGSGADSISTFRVFCGSGAGSSGHFEPFAAPGRARDAISSQLRLRGGLEQPFRAICGSGAGSSGHMHK